MKLTWITILAIALLPQSVSAEGEAKYSAEFSSHPASGQTQLGSQVTTNISKEPDTGTPDTGNRTPGGTRTPATCKQTDKLLTALVPENAKGLTTAEYPVFWFYIPYAAKDKYSIEFSLHDREEMTTLYRTSPQLPQTPGVIGISLPQIPEKSLKLNESYRWRFIVNCNLNQSPGDDLNLEGWVKRVQPSSKSKSEVIWYDQLTNLAQHYLSDPQNLVVKRAWLELLKSVDLEGLVQEPLLSSGSNAENN